MDQAPTATSAAGLPASGHRFGTTTGPPQSGLRPTVRFTLAALLTSAWVTFGVWASEPWRRELDHAIGPVASWVIPTLIAYLPGLVIGLMIATLALTRYREPALDPPSGPWPDGQWPAVTIVVAARDEEAAITRTFESLAALDYPGDVEIILADNGSTDRTAAHAAATAERTGIAYRRVGELAPGKYRALNAALEGISTPLVATVDADTLLQRRALTYLVARAASDPQGQHVSACAGALVASNPLKNFTTRMQQWDYRLGINGVKRMQSSYNCALVAQGAFSVYRTDDLRAVGGWPDAIGEDIVLTWTMLARHGLVLYEPMAVGFTAVPDRVSNLMTQRSRWARGMLEGLHINPPAHQPRMLAKLIAGIDYLVPLLDFGFVFFWIPGLILFVLGYPLIVGWWSMLLLPITAALFGAMRRWQARHVFSRLGIVQASDARGFLGYLLVYQALTSSAALRGYGQYVSRANRRWE